MFLVKGFVKKSDKEMQAIQIQRQGEIKEEKDLKEANAEARRLQKEAIQFEKRTAQQIRELEAERDATNDPDKKRNLEQEIKDKSLQIENRRMTNQRSLKEAQPAKL